MKRFFLGMVCALSVIMLYVVTAPSLSGVGASRQWSSLADRASIPTLQGKASRRTGSMYVVVGKPTISAAFIDTVLCHAASPACGTGGMLYTLGVRSSIDPVFALAFFKEESTFGLYGVARSTRGLGNIRCTPGYACIDGFRAYARWEDGYADWYRLIRTLYVDTWKLTSVEQIVPLYAPASENNTQGYISDVEQAVDLWRSEQE